MSNKEDLEDCTKELKTRERNLGKAPHVSTMVSLPEESMPSKPVQLTNIIDCERFSDAT